MFVIVILEDTPINVKQKGKMDFTCDDLDW